MGSILRASDDATAHPPSADQEGDKHSVVTVVTKCFSDRTVDWHTTLSMGEVVLLQWACQESSTLTLQHPTTAACSYIQGHRMSTHLVITILEVVVKEAPSKGIKLPVLFSIHEGIEFALKEDIQ